MTQIRRTEKDEKMSTLHLLTKIWKEEKFVLVNFTIYKKLRDKIDIGCLKT